MTHPSEDAPLRPGDIVGGRYRVIQAVGDGPMDRLYEAQDVHMHERVIVRLQLRTLAGDAEQVRMFEEQARELRVSESNRSIRVLELSQDSELGHFAAISNKDSLPLPELLSLLSGVHGQRAAPEAKAEAEPDPKPAARPKPRPHPDQDFRFPSSQSQVELETLEPPDDVDDREDTSPRFARPQRPKRLETLELDAPRFGTTTGPRPALSVKKKLDWGHLLRHVGLVTLIVVVMGAGAYLYKDRQEGRSTTTEESAGDEIGSGGVKPPHREVQILFRVTPPKARLRIEGKTAPGHSILVPESEDAFVVQFEAKGYLSRSVKVVPDRNRTIRVVLSPKPLRVKYP